MEKRLLAKLLLQEEEYPRMTCRLIRTATWVLRSVIGVIAGYPYYSPTTYAATLAYSIFTPIHGPLLDIVPVLLALLGQGLIPGFSVAGGLLMVAALDLTLGSEEGCPSLYEPLLPVLRALVKRSGLLQLLIEGRVDRS